MCQAVVILPSMPSSTVMSARDEERRNALAREARAPECIQSGLTAMTCSEDDGQLFLRSLNLLHLGQIQMCLHPDIQRYHVAVSFRGCRERCKASYHSCSGPTVTHLENCKARLLTLLEDGGGRTRCPASSFSAPCRRSRK